MRVHWIRLSYAPKVGYNSQPSLFIWTFLSSISIKQWWGSPLQSFESLRATLSYETLLCSMIDLIVIETEKRFEQKSEKNTNTTQKNMFSLKKKK